MKLFYLLWTHFMNYVWVDFIIYIILNDVLIYEYDFSSTRNHGPQVTSFHSLSDSITILEFDNIWYQTKWRCHNFHFYFAFSWNFLSLTRLFMFIFLFSYILLKYKLNILILKLLKL